MDTVKKMVDKQARIAWIDTAKFLCIVMVLFSHMEYVPAYLQAIFKPFFLTVFFFLTGYVFNSDRGFSRFIVSRIKTLLIPALLFSLVYLLDFKSILQLNYSFQGLLEDISVLLRQQRGQGDMLWFLYVSFLAEIPLFFIVKYIKNRKIVFALSFVLCEASIIYVKHFMEAVPYWYAHVIFVAMFFMVLGKLFRENENKFNKLFANWHFTSLCAIVYIVFVFVLCFKFGLFVNINEYSVNQIIWFLVVILGIYLCIALAKRIPPSKFVLYCGRNTLVFYLLHDRVRGVINFVLQKTPLWKFVFVNDITKTAMIVLVCLAEILVLCVAAEFITRFVPFLIGRKYKIKFKG